MFIMTDFIPPGLLYIIVSYYAYNNRIMLLVLITSMSCMLYSTLSVDCKNILLQFSLCARKVAQIATWHNIV